MSSSHSAQDELPDDQEVRRRLGERLRQLRKSRRLSQEAVAERAGVTYKYVGEIERGLTNPSATSLVRLARALNVSVGELFRTITPERGAMVAPQTIGLLRESVGSLTRLLTEFGESGSTERPEDVRYALPSNKRPKRRPSD